MKQPSAFATGSSLIERAAQIYDFSSGMLIGSTEPLAEPEPEPVFEAPTPRSEREPVLRPAEPRPAGRRAEVSRERLRQSGFILPDAPAGGLAEEFRLVKRQLLLSIGARGGIAEEKRRSLLVTSARPGEGKSFCALNLALSLAGQGDIEVLLIDGDFAKPQILNLLGIEGGPGLVDALADPNADAERFVIATDLGNLSVLPAGRRENNIPELLGSERTREVLAGLAEADPRRIIIFDSPPVLSASHAAILAANVGQAMVVVRADQTTEADLREAVGLLAGCEHLTLLLNGAGFAASGRRFGTYYGREQ